MRLQQLEAAAYAALDRVQKGQPNEDARVEFKREWPEKPEKAARQIAGHSNAAAGDWAIWVVGVCQKEGVVGAALPDFQRWWPEVVKWFEADPPGLVGPVSIDAGGKAVAALAFSPERSPYLVKNPGLQASGGGGIEFEVPWRDGARTRTARRADLMRLLGRQIRNPRIDLIQTSLYSKLSAVQSLGSGSLEHYLGTWYLSAKVVVVPDPGHLLRYLLYRSTVTVDLAPSVPPAGPWKIEVQCDDRKHVDKISVDKAILEIRAAVTLNVMVRFSFDRDVHQLASSAAVIDLAPAKDEPPITLHLPPCVSERYLR